MMTLMKDGEYLKIIGYIENNELVISPYILVNLKYYKRNTNEYKVLLIKRDDQYDAILSEYYDTVQLWASDTVDMTELKKILTDKKYSIVYGSTELLQKLEYPVKESGAIYCLESIKYQSSNSIIIHKKPTEKDYSEIASLVVNDPELGSHSTIENTIKRYKLRNECGLGRNYYCYNENGNVIAHAGTHAECEGCAIIGGVIVDPQYRGKHIGSTLILELCKDLIEENKTIYLIAHNPDAIRIYQKIGFKKKCSWAAAYDS